jgi:hypothetical protein
MSAASALVAVKPQISAAPILDEAWARYRETMAARWHSSACIPTLDE